MLDLGDEADLKTFFQHNYLLHSSGLLNLFGCCSDIEFASEFAGISDEIDDHLAGAFNE